MRLSFVLRAIAVILFLVAAFQGHLMPVLPVPLGLALWCVSTLAS
jgi:hypothetical protein